MKEKTKTGIKRIAITLAISLIGILALLPGEVFAGTSNEQIIGGVIPDPGAGGMAKNPSIDSDGENVVCVFSQQLPGISTYNIYVTTSTDGGANWGPQFLVYQDEMDQHYPDVRLLNVDGENLIAFVVWQEGGLGQPTRIWTRAFYFNNPMNTWASYGTRVLTGTGPYLYPRISGTSIDFDETYFINIQIVWQSGFNPVIEWTDYSSTRGWRNNIVTVVSGEENNYLHPSIDAKNLEIQNEFGDTLDIQSIIVLTYDIESLGTYHVGFKRIRMSKTGDDIEFGNMDVMDFSSQDSPFYPDITISKSIWRPEERESTIYIAAQTIGQEYNEIKIVANDYGGDSLNWHGPYTAGSMEQTSPNIRGVAITTMVEFNKAVKVIWAVNDQIYTEVRTDYFKYDVATSAFIRHGQSPYSWSVVDTQGIGSHEQEYSITYVAISQSYLYEWHCAYTLGSSAVVYYTWKYE